jgi:surface polysaccharide O-acyltransferase-like enzyme
MTRRLASIECFRVLAIFTVILNHTYFVANISHLFDGRFLVVLSGYLIAEMGVPFFLITAGYFFRQSISADGNPVAQFCRYMSPLAWMLLVWTCIYIVTPPDWPAKVFHHGWWQPFYAEALKNLHLLAEKNISLFLQGQRPVWHLWFLPALMCGLATLTLMATCRLERYVVPFIISLYVVVLTEEISGGYFFGFHGGWLSAAIFTATGWWLAERKQLSVAMACSLIIGGYAFALVEGTVMYAICHDAQQAMHRHHFLGGIVLSIGIFTLAIAKPTLGQSTPFPLLTPFTLGVYLSHVFVLYTVGAPINLILGNGIPLRSVLVAVLVYISSVLLTFILARIPLLQCLVMKPAGMRQGKVSADPLTDRSLLGHSDRQIPPHAV